MDAQNARAAHEEPVFTSAAVVAKRNEVQRAFNKLNNTRKPKEPKKKAAEGDKEEEEGRKDVQEEPSTGHDEL